MVSAPLAPEEFGELAAAVWLRHAVCRGGHLHDVVQQAVRDALQNEGLDAELLRAVRSGGATPPPFGPLAKAPRSPVEPLPDLCAHASAAKLEPSLRCSQGDLDGALTEITPKMLDAGEMYEFSGSLWNAAMLLGHPCLGLGVSVMLALAIALNIFIQLGFCLIVWWYMLEDDLTDDYLERLLSFRLGVAHHVRYADTVGRQSLARQVCDRDPKLSTAALHTSFMENWEDFHEGGPFLMLLALTLWMAYILREMRETFAQLDAIISTPCGPRSIIVLVGGDLEDPDGRHPRTHPGYLDSLTVTARIVALTKRRARALGVGIVLPRLLLAGLLGAIGVVYLGRTGRMEDLVLNAMALSFVLGIDEEFFEIFLPRRVQTLVRNLEAAPLNESRRVRRFPTMEPLVAVIAIVAGVMAATNFVVIPFFSRLDQSRDILCSGQLDFVYSLNSASDVVHVTQSAREQGITEIERIVLQVAQPVLWTDASWHVDPSLIALAQDGQPKVAIEPRAPAPNPDFSLDDAGFDDDSFQKVAQISDSSVAEAASLLPCADFATGLSADWSREHLRELVGDSSVTSCQDIFTIDPLICARLNSTRLRAMCPYSCTCRAGIVGLVGPFLSPEFGCPSECLNIGMRTWEVVLGNFFTCEDIGEGNFTGRGDYMPHLYQIYQIIQPDVHVRFHDFYVAYIQGLREYITGESLVAQGVAGGIEALGLSMPELGPRLPELAAHVLSGGLFDEMAAGSWNLFPGTPHPRNLTGCDYLASWEIGVVTNVNLCEEGKLVSIRTWCPKACGCEAGMSGCPSACG